MRYAQSLVISVGLIVVVGSISSIPGLDNGWLLLMPGALLAALVFPQGVNSNGGVLYLVLAGLIDVALLSLLVMWVWSIVERRRAMRRDRNETGPAGGPG